MLVSIYAGNLLANIIYLVRLDFEETTTKGMCSMKQC